MSIVLDRAGKHTTRPPPERELDRTELRTRRTRTLQMISVPRLNHYHNLPGFP